MDKTITQNEAQEPTTTDCTTPISASNTSHPKHIERDFPVKFALPQTHKIYHLRDENCDEIDFDHGF